MTTWERPPDNRVGGTASLEDTRLVRPADANQGSRVKGASNLRPLGVPRKAGRGKSKSTRAATGSTYRRRRRPATARRTGNGTVAQNELLRARPASVVARTWRRW